VTINSVHTNNNDLLSPSTKMSGWVDLPKFLTAKVLCYMVFLKYLNVPTWSIFTGLVTNEDRSAVMDEGSSSLVADCVHK